jgi:pyruvyl transferase EpsI
MGSQWKNEENFHRRVVQDFLHNPMVIFPQTIYYASDATDEAEESKPIYTGHKNLTIVAREKVSLSILSDLYPGVAQLLTPDIVLSASMDTFGAKPQERSGVLLCMRSDEEKAVTDEERKKVEEAVQSSGEAVCYTDMYGHCRVTKENRMQCVKEKMEELASARVVITDRLHGMVLSAITGTPCIVFSNYNHKVRGTYEWIKYLPYIRYVETVEEAAELLPAMLKMGGQTYDNSPLMPCFEILAQVVRGYANN